MEPRDNERNAGEHDEHAQREVAPSLHGFTTLFPEKIKKPGELSREQGAILGEHYLCLGDKPFGVEPGFLAVNIADDAFANAVQQNRDKMVEDELIAANDTPAEIKEKLAQDQDYAKNFAAYLNANNKKLNLPFTIWMWKQDYDDPDLVGRVGVPIQRYRETLKRPQAKPKLKTPRLAENRNALYEALANDISTYFGIPTQTQRLVHSQYKNGEIKFMTTCQLAPGYRDIASVYDLAGDIYKPGQRKGLYQNYLYEKNKPQGSKTAQIKNLGVVLALQLLLEDNDLIGAYGQNMGMVGDDIFMIDLGKAFRRGKFSKILDTLKTNGQFGQPLAWLPFNAIRRHVLFRNSSILFDAPYHEIMQGMHMLNKLVYGIEPSAEIKASYGEDFVSALAKVKPKGLDSLFASHEENLLRLKEEVGDVKQQKEIDYYLRELRHARHIAKKNAEVILGKFTERLRLPREQVALLSNLEKLTSRRVLDTTSDGKRRLSNLQVDMFTRVEWGIKMHQTPGLKPDGTYWLYFDSSKHSGKNTLNMLREFMKHHGIKDFDNEIIYDNSINTQYAGITAFRLTKPQLDKLVNIITEENVHAYRMPLSSAESAIKKTEKALQDFATQKRSRLHAIFSWFSRHSHAPRVEIYGAVFQFEEKGDAADKNQNIRKLAALLGMLGARSNKNFKKQLLKKLNCHSEKEANQRIIMLLQDALLAQYPQCSVDEVNGFIKGIKEQMALLDAKIATGEILNNSNEINKVRRTLGQAIDEIIQENVKQLHDNP